MRTLSFAVLAALCVAAALPLRAGEAKPAKTAAELEKEKALSNPYPNDLGPDTLDEATLKSYPADRQEGYKLLKVRCTVCHTASRPLNSRFVEPEGADQPARDKAAAELNKKHKDLTVWQIEGGVWNRYVKRMMAKPGCNISKEEGKKIWQFLVYDSKRKVGDGAEKWAAHRKKLVEELKAKNPARYKELSEAKDL